MPLVRFEVRNEYSLGQPELYKEANGKREDPKAVLDGVAVAGLVGILRQLGDLAQFAAEVFHGLQEQVTTTASRSHKLMARVQNIEAALPSLEKAVLAQTSHIHFTYTAGSEWHSRSQISQNHFIYNDLPRYIMDSYEECRDPPRLHLLDKFDTGGPGSCLKRYSDPSFFRRASGNFKELDAEELPKEKKARKTKKKRSSQGNVDIVHSGSVPNQSARMPSNATTVDGHTSPSHTTSTTDMTYKSDRGDHSNSFNSRIGSAYVECVFHLNSSVQPEDHKSKEFHSRFMHHKDTADLVIHDEELDIATDNFHQNSSPKPIMPGSTCYSWDGKAEKMEPDSVHSDENEAPEMFPADSVLGIRSGDIVDCGHREQASAAFDNEKIMKSTGRNELGEVENEPDKYVDALNIIESESENDLHCQTKHDVEQFAPILDNENIEDKVNEFTEHLINDPSENESHIASDLSLNKEAALDLPTSVPSNIFFHEHVYHVSGHPSNSDDLPGAETFTSADALDDLKMESIASVSDPLSSGLRVSSIMEPSSDKAVSSYRESQESPTNLVSVQPVSFWTNGGLLGLEPSKPPDFAVAKTSSKRDEEAIHSLNHLSTPSCNGEIGKSGRLVEDDGSVERSLSSECPRSHLEGQDAKLEKTGYFNHSNRFSRAGEGHKITGVVELRKEQPVDTNVRAICTKENEENPSQMFGLGHRLLINGFCRKISLDPNSEPDLDSSLEVGASHQRNGHHNPSNHVDPNKTLNEKFGQKTSAGSLTASPPLEHMKISFHPIDGFEASKLNLKFPDGNQSHGSIDMFQAFQLVPEPTIQLKDAGSDSDEDTFCRSSPYMSDDYRSHHSYSDSEQWESDKSPENKDRELYDALCRMPPIESDPSSLQLLARGNNDTHINSEISLSVQNGVDPSVYPSMLDLPSFDVVNPVIPGKSYVEARNVIELQYPNDPYPSPLPPPPPLQWWTTKTASCMAEDKQNTIFGAREQEADKSLSVSTVSQQHKTAPANEKCRDEQDLAHKQKSKKDKKTVQTDANMPAIAKGMDENDNFLHQIRTKSFNLRRTAATKPTFASGLTANDKVTAILEKAIAIRQAVASDDGEDDAWSDT